MLHTRTAIEYRAGAAAAIAPSIVGVDTFAESPMSAVATCRRAGARSSSGGFLSRQ